MKVRENIITLNKCVDDMLRKDKSLATPNEWDNVMDPNLPTRREKPESKKGTSKRCSVCKEIGHTKPRCPLNCIVMSTPSNFQGSCSATQEDFFSGSTSIFVSFEPKHAFQ